MHLFNKLFRGTKNAKAALVPAVVVGVVITVESAETVASSVEQFQPKVLDVAGDVHGVLTVVGENQLRVERLEVIETTSPTPSNATTLVGSPNPSHAVTVCEAKPEVVAPPASEDAPKSVSADGPSPAARALNINAFRLLRFLGGGGQGQVWLVEHIATKKLYALKAMNKSAIGEAHYSSAFVEQDVMKLLSGDAFFNSLKGSFEDDEFFFVLMDYHPGGDLHDKIKKGPLAEGEVRRIAAEILHAMEVLHKRGIIHRDLKPQNILFNARGEAIVADLGLARTFGRSTDEQPWRKNVKWQLREDHPDFVPATKAGDRTRAQCGTLRYMAPEVLAKYEYSYEVDVWSFAVTLYQMLHGGKLPFGGDENVPTMEFAGV
ncbi:kinase-like domain-containing protein [Trametes meyenii]|nr:kinase-like domain-containing protein [Trametes meyenii]